MWEEYTPQEGKPYSPGTMGMMENGNRYSWVDASGIHHEATSRLDRFRRLTPVFAAAPDLLEALQKMVELTPIARDGSNLMAITGAREALRKAIG